MALAGQIQEVSFMQSLECCSSRQGPPFSWRLAPWQLCVENLTQALVTRQTTGLLLCLPAVFYLPRFYIVQDGWTRNTTFTLGPNPGSANFKLPSLGLDYPTFSQPSTRPHRASPDSPDAVTFAINPVLPAINHARVFGIAARWSPRFILNTIHQAAGPLRRQTR
jgi:hypothetical protein